MRFITGFSIESRLRCLVVFGCLGLVVLAATGVIEAKVFAQPSLLKYALTIGAPLLILFGALVERPSQLAVFLLVIGAPLIGATTHFAGTRISLIIPLLASSYFLTAIAEPVRGLGAGLRRPALLLFPLFLIPLVDGRHASGFVKTALLIMATAYVVARAVAEEGGLEAITAAVTVQAVLQSGVAIWEAKSGHQLNLYGAVGGVSYGSNYAYNFGGVTRPTGTFNDPIGLSNALAISIPLMVALALHVRQVRYRVVLVAATAIAGLALAYALDRTSWIGVAVGLVLLIALLPAAVRRPALPWIISGVIAGVCVILVAEGNAITQKFDSIFHPTKTAGLNAAQAGIAAGEQARLVYWSLSLKAFFHHLLGGLGINELQPLLLAHTNAAEAGSLASSGDYSTNAASTYLQLLAEGGLLVLFWFLTLLWGLLVDVRAGLKRNPVLAAGIAGAVVATLICWFTDIVVLAEQPVAACVGVLFGMVAGAAARPVVDPGFVVEDVELAA